MTTMEELEKELQKHFTKALIGITDEQIGLIAPILKQCYRMVLIGCAFGTMDERFGMFFNGLQDLLKEFSDEAYTKAFTLGNDIFMQIAKDKEKHDKDERTSLGSGPTRGPHQCP